MSNAMAASARRPTAGRGGKGEAIDDVGDASSAAIAWLRPAGWALALAALLLGLANAYMAFDYPLELEGRESVVWMDALAIRGGVDIYDHSQVAFVTSGHGPLDSLLKSFLSRLLPTWRGPMICRLPVLLLPIVSVLFGWMVMGPRRRDRLLLGVLLGALVYVGGLGLRPFHLLVGRSDPTAMCFMLLATGVQAVICRPIPGRRRAILLVAFGLLHMATFLTSWRFVTIQAPLVLLMLGTLRYRIDLPWKAIGKGMLAVFAGASALLLPILGVCFHWSLALYWRHFFGLFTDNTAVVRGTFAQFLVGMPEYHVPGLLHTQGTLVLTLGAVVFAIILWRRAPDGPERKLAAVTMAAMLAAVGVTYVSLYVNFVSGGVHYLAPLLAYVAFQAAHWEERSAVASRAIMPILCVCLLIGVNWASPADQLWTLSSTRARAGAYSARMQRIDADAGLASEDMHFYKKAYRGEKIDIGDTCEEAMNGHMFDSAFDDRVRAHMASLNAQPPRFIVTSLGANTSALRELATRRYEQVAVFPHLYFGGGRPSAILKLK